MTHPDDEISIAAWISRLTRQGNPVFLSWTHTNPTREAEAKAAALLLGVDQSRLFFHGASDGAVCLEMAELVPKFRSMVEAVKPQRICCGAFEQGHLDHDATNFLVNEVADCPVFEIPFYHTYTTRLQTLNRFSDPRGQEILELSPDEQAFKRIIAKQYPSQNIWRVLLWYEISQNVRFRRMQLAKTERMRLQSPPNYRKPNHPYRIGRKVLVSASWRKWRRALKTYSQAAEGGRGSSLP